MGSIADIIVGALEAKFGSQFKAQHSAIGSAIEAAILPQLLAIHKRLKVVEDLTGASSAVPKTPDAPPTDTNPSVPTSDLSIP